MVCLAWAARRQPVKSVTEYFKGDRDAIRRAAVKTALHGLQDLMKGLPVKG
jgi:nicotinamide-nucleotide amidase